MNIVCVGGGSGGHVTPVLAVINELNRLEPSAHVLFVCDRAFESQSRGLMKHAAGSVAVRTVTAGKLRRYHGVAWWKQLLDIPTVIKNIRDIFLVGVGTIQSVWLLWRFKPDVMFAKGGYVCLPVGIAAKLLRIPIVIHDSDTRPGLTNKVLSRWAVAIATGAPLQNYNYPKEISQYTGVPIHTNFHPFSKDEQQAAKEALGITDLRKPLIVVTGGGLGAKSINEAMLDIAPELLKRGAAMYHITGKGQYESIEKRAHQHADYILTPFVYKDMATVLGAADIVVARGSATFLQELAALQKAVIVIPAGHLSDQVKNAEVFESAEAAVVLTDKTITARPSKLAEAIAMLIDEPAEAHRIAAQLHAFAKPDAAANVAAMIIDVYSKRTKKKIEGGIDGAIS